MLRMFENTQLQLKGTRLTVKFEYDAEIQISDGFRTVSDIFKCICSSTEHFESVFTEMKEITKIDESEEKVLESTTKISVKGKMNDVETNQAFTDIESFKKFLEDNSLISKSEQTLKLAV